MDRSTIKEVLREALGANISLHDHAKWVGLHCPFAPWTHATGRDSHPSAGVSVKEEDVSIFNCQACHIKMPVAAMLRELSEYDGGDYGAIIEQLESESFLGGDLKPWGQKSGSGVRRLGEPLNPQVYLDLYDPVGDHWYLQERGITHATAHELGLQVDPSDSAGKERILFPVYSHKGGLYGFTGRAVDEGVYPRVRDYYGLPKEFLLLGSQFVLQKESEYLILVEGLFDHAKLFQYGFPAVAYMSGAPTEHQIDVLLDIGLPVYFFKDNDITGEQAQENLKETKLCQHLPVMKVKYPSRKVTGADGLLRPLKDPDELKPEEIEKMVSDARLL